MVCNPRLVPIGRRPTAVNRGALAVARIPHRAKGRVENPVREDKRRRSPAAPSDLAGRSMQEGVRAKYGLVRANMPLEKRIAGLGGFSTVKPAAASTPRLRPRPAPATSTWSPAL